MTAVDMYVNGQHVQHGLTGVAYTFTSNVFISVRQLQYMYKQTDFVAAVQNEAIAICTGRRIRSNKAKQTGDNLRNVLKQNW